MSSVTTLARPYAKAAFELAQDERDLARWESMLTLASQIASDDAVAGLLDNPLVSREAAAGLITEAAGEQFNDRFRGFLDVLADNNRLPLLSEVTRLFRELRAEAEKRLHVRVVSAVPLDAGQTQRLQEALARRFDLQIELENEIDAAVIGGAVVYAGDEVIDGSLRGRLQKLANSLAH